MAIEVGEVALGVGAIRTRVELPGGDDDVLWERAQCRALLAIVEGDLRAAWRHLEEARALAVEGAWLDAVAEAARFQGELAWAFGDLDGAATALRDAFGWNRPLVAMFPGLLLAETWLRLGERDRVRDLAVRLLQSRISPIGQARAHALLATCAAVDGDRTDARHHLAQTTGVRGAGQEWLTVHRGWVGLLTEGRAPEVPVAPSLPLDLALRVGVSELGGPVPTWALG
jgi:hypothetical protein